MPTLQASGTQAASVGTEHTLQDVAIAGTFTVHVDMHNMVAGDTLELRVYTKVLSTSALNCTYFVSYAGAQSVNALNAISVPVSNDITSGTPLRFTLKQTAGTGRSYDWKVLKY